MIDVLINNSRLRNIDGIMFDLDGTLIDTLDLHIESFQWVLRQFGKEASKEDLNPLMGRTPQSIIGSFLSDLPRNQIWKAAEEKEEYLEKLIQKVYVYSGVRTLLDALGKRKVKRIVISSTHKKLVFTLLIKAGIIELIDHVVSGDEIILGKPHPEPFLLGLQKSQIKSSHALGIGDSIFDFQSCNEAGIQFVGVLTGKTSKKQFIESGATYLINSIQDLKIFGNTD